MPLQLFLIPLTFFQLRMYLCENLCATLWLFFLRGTQSSSQSKTKKLFIMIRIVNKSESTSTKTEDEFKYFVDQFEDMRVLKYKLPAFEELSLQQKKFIYYLSEAALSGRDILWDQNFRYNLQIRKTTEAIIASYSGDKERAEYKSFITWAKRMFFVNGIHHHYSSDKLKPGITIEYFISLMKGVPSENLPLLAGQSVENLISVLVPVLFDEKLYAKKVELKAGVDMITESASNFYSGVTQKEVEKFYASKIMADDRRPVSHGLNSQVLKIDGVVAEDVYKSGGKYGAAIDKIVLWLEKAIVVAETENQKTELNLLIEFYKSGDLKVWDEYNIAWAKNTGTMVDYINGFIENYEDPLGMKATWESVVEYTDVEATRRTKIITANAQWFEDNSPVQSEYKKEKVKGVAAKVINVAMLGGDCYPASPLGINPVSYTHLTLPTNREV